MLRLGVDSMDNQMILQMMQNFLPPESRGAFHALNEVAELQQTILSHAAGGGDNWQIEMLEAIRPRLPEHNRHMADILIKCMELAVLLEKGRANHEHRGAV